MFHVVVKIITETYTWK